jgi:hypothetical protein
LAFLLALPAGAQVLRGTVVDSVSQRGIPGVVVMMLNAKGVAVGRTLTDAAGKYATTIPSDAARVRALRIGWRPRERALPDVIEGIAQANFTMPQIPTFLEPARIDAKQCPRRNDSQQALGLWEQVRAGLLATIVAREQNPATMVRLGFERSHSRVDEDITLFRVRRDSANRSLNSYRAVRSASDFIRDGFAGPASDRDRMYYAPDAEVLIDGAFADGYCFRIQRADRARRNQIGLGFTSADRKRGRMDIAGTLWVDTVERSIREIEYQYVGQSVTVDDMKPGGSIWFREMPNGQVLIDRWQMRLIGNHLDSIPGRTLGGSRETLNTFFTSYTGGELAHVRWPDGTRYDAELARVTITARTPTGVSPAGRMIDLVDSPYSMVLDSTGVFEVKELLPGPYRVMMREPRLKPLMMDTLSLRARVNAERGKSALVSVTVPTLEEWVMDRCGLKYAQRDSAMMVIGRIMDTSGRSHERATFQLLTLRALSDTTQAWVRERERGRTDASGVYQVCESPAPAGVKRFKVVGELADGQHFEWESAFTPGRLLVMPVVIDRPARRP